MKKLAYLLFAFFASSISVSAATYYVSYVSGNDLNNGTSLGSPYKTITKAVAVCVAGDIIYLRGEVHSYTAKIDLNKSGNAVNRISLLAYPSDVTRPIINFTGQAVGIRGIQLSGNYWYIKGIDICKSGDNGMHISGAYNIIEFCAFYENGDTGLQLANGANNNQVINCDSYYNIDASEGNADGYAAKLDVGTGNSFKGCRAWQNSDDGWDGLLNAGIGTNPSTTYDSCWCFLNGYRKDMTASTGNGNGFKMGGNSERHDATLRNCLAVYNRVKGFDQNNNTGSMTLYNCTGYKNGPNFGMPSSNLASGETMVLTNCISYSNRTGSNSITSIASQTTNSWQSPFVVDASDFVSLDTSVLRGPRNANGSLPTINLLKLAQGSDMINSGTNVGLPYYGSAPDLGYAESNYAFPVEMLSFSATAKNGNVELSWKTATEFQNKGWDIERHIPGDIAWQKLGFVQGQGTSSLINNYSFIDSRLATASTIQYRLKQIDENGLVKYSNIVSVRFSSTKTELSNYPNPVKNTTTAIFNIGKNSKVKLQLYNTSGQLVQTITNENLFAGDHTYQLNTSGLTAGEYYLKLIVDNSVFTRSVIKIN